MTTEPGSMDMGVKAQTIEIDGKPAFAVVPWDVWVQVRDRVEDMEDEAAIAEARAESKETFPAALVEALIAGTAHPVKLFREHRGLTQRDLAERVGIDPVYLSQIETGRRAGSVSTLRKLAQALDVELELILPRDDGVA